MNKHLTNLLGAGLLCLAGSAPALAADTATSAAPEEKADAADLVQEAAKVVDQISADSDGRELLRNAQGVFIVPDYGRASLGVGGAGGEGVLVANNAGNWSGPAFFNIGSVNLGLEAGVEAGSIAFIMMSHDAMQNFRQENSFSLNADAGLTIIDWSKRAQASAGKGADVVVWADTEGLYGNLAVSVTDIFWDGEANRAYYARNVNVADVVGGAMQAPAQNDPLKSEFSALESGEPMQQRPND